MLTPKDIEVIRKIIAYEMDKRGVPVSTTAFNVKYSDQSIPVATEADINKWFSDLTREQ